MALNSGPINGTRRCLVFLRNELGTVPCLVALCNLSLLIALVICLSVMSEKDHLGGGVSVVGIQVGEHWG